MNGPERSTTIEMKTTTAAVIAILKASSSQNDRSGGICNDYLGREPLLLRGERSDCAIPLPPTWAARGGEGLGVRGLCQFAPRSFHCREIRRPSPPQAGEGKK